MLLNSTPSHYVLFSGKQNLFGVKQEYRVICNTSTNLSRSLDSWLSKARHLGNILLNTQVHITRTTTATTATTTATTTIKDQWHLDTKPIIVLIAQILTSSSPIALVNIIIIGTKNLMLFICSGLRFNYRHRSSSN